MLSAGRWLDRLTLRDAKTSLRSTYGEDERVIEQRVNLYGRVLAQFCRVFGQDKPVFIVRCPSRVNWEGHHVDHQGGCYNATTQAQEMVAVCGIREDDWVIVHHVESLNFPSCRFRIGELTSTASPERRWEQFPKGVWLSLKEQFPEVPLHGLNLAVGGDIPIGRGMSSSHALLVTCLLAAAAANDLTLERRDAVRLVQRADWLAGARTGLGDQATMLFGRRGFIFHSPVGNADEISPLYVPLPEDYALMLADSFTHHTLTGEQALAYNGRVFTCCIALPLLLQTLLEIGVEEKTIASVERPADITPESMSLQMIYRGLLAIAQNLPFDSARILFQNACRHSGVEEDFENLVETYFPTGILPETIPVRGVLMYTLAECWRSSLFARHLQEGNVLEAGRLMNIGHEGDRIAAVSPETGEYADADHSVTDSLLNAFLADLESGDPSRVERAQLQYQPGDYRASTPILDQMVDIARDCDAVGASLTGAGHGGTVIALVGEDNADAFTAAMLNFYRERSLTPEQSSRGVRRCATVEAAGLVRM